MFGAGGVYGSGQYFASKVLLNFVEVVLGASMSFGVAFLFRSSWGDPNAIFVGIKAGYNQAHHGHVGRDERAFSERLAGPFQSKLLLPNCLLRVFQRDL